MEGIKPNTNLPKVCFFSSWYKILVCFFCILFFLQLNISCSGSQVQKTQAKGIYHRVKKGETAWSIARAYNIKLQDLAEINNIEDPALIKEDIIIFIPDASQVIDDVMTHAKGKGMDVPVSAPIKTDSSASVKKPIENNTPKEEKIVSRPKAKLPVEEKEKIQREEGRFIWPVRGSVKTRFGIQPNKTYHNWIKIVSVAGMPVKGAASGTVIFSSALKDYGETIIIRHEKEFATVYTHLNQRYVKIDQNVKKGETIASVGQKDKAGNAYINFEIRLRGKARNPLFFLP
jgi:Membrane proteins related to metalloendopeptidases